MYCGEHFSFGARGSRRVSGSDSAMRTAGGLFVTDGLGQLRPKQRAVE